MIHPPDERGEADWSAGAARDKTARLKGSPAREPRTEPDPRATNPSEPIRPAVVATNASGDVIANAEPVTMSDKQTTLDADAKYCPDCGNKLTEENRSNLFGRTVCADCLKKDLGV